MMEYHQKSFELSMKRKFFRKDSPDIQGGLGTPVILQSNLKTDDSLPTNAWKIVYLPLK